LSLMSYITGFEEHEEMALDQALQRANGGDGDHRNNSDHSKCEVSMTSLDEPSSIVDFNTPTSQEKDGGKRKSSDEIITNTNKNRRVL
jgi:hypothetical protein